MGRFGDAIAMFEKSLRIQPSGAHALRLAVVYARMGKRQTALDTLATTSTTSSLPSPLLSFTTMPATALALALISLTVTAGS
ncbi:MAG: hypothetical protein ACR2G5_11515 [Pyrinomonadaceae bacterium]